MNTHLFQQDNYHDSYAFMCLLEVPNFPMVN